MISHFSLPYYTDGSIKYATTSLDTPVNARTTVVYDDIIKEQNKVVRSCTNGKNRLNFTCHD